MRRMLIFLLILCGVAHADEQVPVCYNFGCTAEQTVAFSEPRLIWAEEMLAAADTPDRERQLLSAVLGRLYAWAGQQSPIKTDRAGNFNDSDISGGMDCIDHSTTTTRILHMLEKRGALKFHRVLEPVRRGWMFQHFSAQIEEAGPQLMPAETGQVNRFAVDSWYVDNGRPVPVMPIDLWKDGREPEQI